MTVQTMTVVQADKDGVLDIAGNASALAGNAGGGDYFQFPNDGRTVLAVDGVTGDIFTFAAVNDPDGRTETLAPTVAGGDMAIIGPFLPDIWNQSDGQIRFTPTAGNANDKLLAVRVSDPS